ncbi:LysR family transcriptional regulator [Cryptosporangium arvum]|uniref:Transcriptional regulator n=1 Tax=Cryptosporangium arvum DSM 44712 TaxID=927661 RepID=A0A010ZTQ4_9ACTN|nr:LysR family transcriptional regulator [Cryptosporangium arvum]EXG82084.1 transcriptional regulator [Cryptosporangium arvum DSM 44712]
MDLDALRYVVTLAEELHFGRAAAEHFVAAGHFGRRVQRLERELGVRLFERTSRRVTLTPEGARVVAHARTVLAEVAELRSAAEIVRDTDESVLRVGVLGFGMADRWPALRALLRAVVPGVRLVHEELDLWNQYDAVRRGDIDVGLVHYLGDLDGLVFEPVLTSPSVVVVPVASALADAPRLTRDDVADAGWITLSGAHPRMADWAGPASHGPRRAPAVRTPGGIPSAVATSGLLGLHGGAAARYYARPDVRFVPFDGAPVEVAAVLRDSDDRPIVQAFRRAAAAVAAVAARGS